jgi:hypothetical protein
MNRRFAAIGLLLLLFPADIAGATAAADMVYPQVKSLTQMEYVATRGVAKFTADIMKNATLAYLDGKPLEITPDDVIEAMDDTRESWNVCKGLETPIQCSDLRRDIQSVANREMEVIRLGHNLQAIATSYEQPINAFSLSPQTPFSSLASILGIWGIAPLPQTGTGYLRSIRMYPVPETVSSQVSDLEAGLASLKNPEEDNARYIATVWRYYYGLDFVEHKSSDEAPNGDEDKGERQLIFKREGGTEENLRKLRDAIASAINPPPKNGEIVYVSGMTFWAYVRDTSKDKENDDTKLPAKDIGLQWMLALEPNMPYLGGGTLGGSYPPMPEIKEDNSASKDEDKRETVLAKGTGGLCRSLEGSEGYLCHEPRLGNAKHDCKEDEDSEPEDSSSIVLTPCTPPDDNAADEDSSSSESKNTVDMCLSIREENTSSKGEGEEQKRVCEPDSNSQYPYTVLGHVCYIRECAMRSYDHTFIPGRDPLVSQESAAPWNVCAAIPPKEDPLLLPAAPIIPPIPAYNPEARLRELNMEYCQTNAAPPLSPPYLCTNDSWALLPYLQAVPLGNALKLVQEVDPLSFTQRELAMEAMGLDVGTTLYRDYLQQVSTSLNGSLSATVESLKRLAASTFPDTMCPLDPQEAKSATLCKTAK